MSKQRGLYIVIEGIDGSGKTTQFNHLVGHLKEATGVREPGGTPMSERIRTIIKDRDIPRSGEANSFLFAACRADLVANVIRPAIESGRHVVADRNWLSTLAYQSAEGVDPEEIKHLSRIAMNEFFEPDLVILMDVDPAVCYQRTHTRGGAEDDYFDSKGREYFDKVRRAYLDNIASLKNGEVIDAAGTPEEVWERIKPILQKKGIA